MQASIWQVSFCFKKSFPLQTDFEEFWMVLILTHHKSDMKSGHFVPQAYT